MDGYIAKPIRAKDLYKTIETTAARVLRSRQRNKSTLDESKALNRDKILEQTGGSAETLEEIVELFAIESDKLMKRIRRAITDKDASELQRAAHTLKGSVRIFGAKRPAAAAQRLETMGREKNLLDAEHAWQELVKEIELLKPLLDDLTGTPFC